MIVEFLLLALALVVLTSGFAFLNYRAELLRRKAISQKTEIDFLKDKLEIQGNHIDHIYNVLLSICGEVKSLQKTNKNICSVNSDEENTIEDNDI